MAEITAPELSVICDAVVRLTELRQNECKHLTVENVAPEIMRNLLQELAAYKSGYTEVVIESGG